MSHRGTRPLPRPELTPSDSTDPPDSEVPPYIPVFKGPRALFSTPGTNSPKSIAELPNGEIIIGGSAEGVIAPTDGTLSRPLLLRIRPDATIIDTTIYRAMGFGSVRGVKSSGTGLTALISTYEVSPPHWSTQNQSTRLYNIRLDGVINGTLFKIRDARSSGYTPILFTADGGYLLLFSSYSAADYDMIKLSPEGSAVWTYSSPDDKFVFTVTEARNGDLVLVTREGARQFNLVTLGSDGRQISSRTQGDPSVYSSVNRINSVDDGIVVLGRRHPPQPESFTIFLSRFSGDGDLIWDRVLAEGNDYSPGELVSLPGGSVVVTWNQFFGFDHGSRTEMAKLSSNGDLVWTRYFEPNQGTARITALHVLSSNKLVVAGYIGPERLGGYGGDPLDIVVHIEDL